jgi:hypothetical protein
MPFTDYPNYIGWLLLLLAVGAWWLAGRRLVVALAAVFLLAVLVSFGRYGSPIYRVLFDHLPFFNKFRVPSMILILPCFVTVWLAGQGAVTLAQSGGGQRWRRVAPLMLLALGGLLLLAGATGLVQNAYLEQMQRMLQKAGRTAWPALLAAAWNLQRADLIRIGLILLVAATALLLARRNETFRTRRLLWVLALLAAIDLMMVDRRLVHPERSLVEVVRDASGRWQLLPASSLLRAYEPPQRDLEQMPAMSALATAVGHDRVWPLGRLADQNHFMVAGIRSLGGYHPAKLAAYQKVREHLYNPQAPAARLAAWLGGRAVAFSDRLPEAAIEALNRLGTDLDPVPFHDDGMFLYTNRAALPRARLATRYVLADSLPAARDLPTFLTAIAEGRWQPGQVVVLDQAPVPAPHVAAESLPAVNYLRDDLNEVVLEVAAHAPAVLVLADMAAPGWEVSVNGDPAALLRADLILRAVALPAGQHTVRFHYHDPALRRGLALTGIGLTATVALLVWPVLQRLWQRRGRAGPGAPGSVGGKERDA